MKKVKLEQQNLQGFYNYIQECLTEKWLLDSQTFTDLLHFHLQEIKCKIEVCLLKIIQKRSKGSTINLNYGDIITLSYVFKYIEAPPYLRSLEYNIIGAIM